MSSVNQQMGAGGGGAFWIRLCTILLFMSLFKMYQLLKALNEFQ
jgi:hypothetical protein